MGRDQYRLSPDHRQGGAPLTVGIVMGGPGVSSVRVGEVVTPIH